jgi:hypothetical protein
MPVAALAAAAAHGALLALAAQVGLLVVWLCLHCQARALAPPQHEKS